ncbi:class I SAM-dependent methyltransferase [Desulfofalx alkaliphila]|uniref:class I SAM-dependent methyltransferase n=1 Tax=Desulfofalx alkaliphila TaxID=105483 RepID=UPI0004E20DA1|nr:class I SAM-dependent methyltransferase [Desulfofalx alkaliphila]
MFKGQKRAVDIAQQFIGQSLPSGGLAVDATAGNGNDTLFLARTVGRSGRVFAFDIQQEALDKTAQLLEEHHLLDVVNLVHSGHQNMEEHVKEPVDAVMFNLGYLPGGDHKIITEPENTVSALNSAIKMLKVGGKISLVVYTGHRGGADELNAIEQVVSSLDSHAYWAVTISFANRPPTAPVIFLIERVG